MRSAETSPSTVPDTSSLESSAADNLQQRLDLYKELHDALQTHTPTALAFDLFKTSFLEKSGKLDYLIWADQESQKPEGYHQRILFDEYKAVPYPLKSANIKVTTLSDYLNIMIAKGVSLKGFWDSLPALPLFQIGPLVGVGHFNPLVDVSDYFPGDLIIPCSLNISDYEALLAYCREQSELFYDENDSSAYDPNKTIDQSDTIDSYLKMSEQEPALAERRKLLIAEFLLSQPTVSTEKKHQLREVLREDKPQFSISEEYDMAIDYLSEGKAIFAPDALEVTEDLLLEQPVREWESVKALPFLATNEAVYLLCQNASDYALDDTVSGFTNLPIKKIQVTGEALLRQFQPFQKHENDFVETTGAVIADNDFAFILNSSDMEGYSPTEDENPNKFVQWVLYEGINRNVSDIHIEKIKGQMTVRYAMDGRGVVFTRLPEYRFNPITSTIKRLAQIQLDSTKPGEGRITFSCSGRAVEVRVSVVYDHSRKPCIVMRLLDKSLGLKKITELGLFTDEIDTLRRCYQRRSGIIVVGGATGDGKSTTLNSIMTELNQEENFCFSLEDPVEYEIDGVTQINATADPVRVEKGELSFSDGIKKLLRQDPDVIMVGEIRDAYTAETAIEAALTGHLVLSTVHAIDCFSVVTRLLKWKIDPFNVADTLVLSISQKLIRRLCDCQALERVTDPMREHFEKYGVPLPPNKRAILKEHGCAMCNFKGFKGRNALMEFLVVSPAIRELIREGASSRKILDCAVSEGFRSRYQKGLKKVIQGITSMSEIAAFCENA